MKNNKLPLGKAKKKKKHSCLSISKNRNGKPLFPADSDMPKWMTKIWLPKPHYNVQKPFWHFLLNDRKKKLLQNRTTKQTLDAEESTFKSTLSKPNHSNWPRLGSTPMSSYCCLLDKKLLAQKTIPAPPFDLHALVTTLFFCLWSQWPCQM